MCAPRYVILDIRQETETDHLWDRGYIRYFSITFIFIIYIYNKFFLMKFKEQLSFFRDEAFCSTLQKQPFT